MLNARECATLAENQRLLEERERDLRLVARGQFREAILLAAEERGEEWNPISDVAELYERLCGGAERCSAKFALFCLEYEEAHRKRISVKTLLQNEESEPPAEPGKIAYLKNVFTDGAYRAFSARLRGLTAAYYPSYAAACEEVYYGRSAGAILPMFNATDGKLLSFKRMLTKYDLKIASACRRDEEENATVYVLARKGLNFDSPEYLDMTVVLPDAVSPAAFLSACETFRVRTELINAVPAGYSSSSYGRYEFDFHFSVRDAALAAFALFLEASHIRYSTEGLYKIYE